MHRQHAVKFKATKSCPKRDWPRKWGKLALKLNSNYLFRCVLLFAPDNKRDRKRNSDNSGQMTPISSLFFSCPCSKRCIIAANYYYCQASAIRDAGERGNLCTMARQSNGSAEQISLLGHRLEAAQVSSTPPATLTGDWH